MLTYSVNTEHCSLEICLSSKARCSSISCTPTYVQPSTVVSFYVVNVIFHSETSYCIVVAIFM